MVFKDVGNALVIVGNILSFVGVVGTFLLPLISFQIYAHSTSLFILLVGLILMTLGFSHTISTSKEKGITIVNIVGVIIAIALIGIACIMYTQIN